MPVYNLHMDRELLLRMAHHDDQSAFTALYNQYWDRLYLLAYRHLQSSGPAEEIVQEVFFQLWKKRKALHIESLPAYLAAMTRYAVYRHLASLRKKRQQQADYAMKEKPTEDHAEDFDNKLLLEIIEKLSNELPEKCRLVFIQNKLLDYSLERVAAHMEISKKTAEAHLTKALRHIRNALGNSGEYV